MADRAVAIRTASVVLLLGAMGAIVTVRKSEVFSQSPPTAEPQRSPSFELPDQFEWVTAALDPPIGTARRIKLIRGPGSALAIVEQPGRGGSDGINAVGEGPTFNPRHSPVANAKLAEVPTKEPGYRLFDLERLAPRGPRLRFSMRADGVARLLVLDEAGDVTRVVTLEPSPPRD